MHASRDLAVSRITLIVAGVVCILVGIGILGLADVHRVTVTYTTQPVDPGVIDADDAVVFLPDTDSPIRQTGTAAIDGRTAYEGVEIRIGSIDATAFLTGPAGPRLDAPLTDARYVRTPDRAYRLVADRDAVDLSIVTDAVGGGLAVLGAVVLWVGIDD